MPNEINPPLQVRPEGLLGFFDIKRGNAPRLLSIDLAAQLDLTDWYLYTNAIGVPSPAASAIAAVGFQSFGHLVVPPNEFWYVEEFGLLSSKLGAGQALQFQCGVIGAQAEVTPVGQPSNLGTVGDRCNAFMDRPRWVPPSGGLVLLCTRVTAGPVNVDAHARFTRLPL